MSYTQWIEPVIQQAGALAQSYFYYDLEQARHNDKGSVREWIMAAAPDIHGDVLQVVQAGCKV